MAKWFLVRHGSTAWNKEGRAQGQTDTPLDDAGQIMAYACATAPPLACQSISASAYEN